MHKSNNIFLIKGYESLFFKPLDGLKKKDLSHLIKKLVLVNLATKAICLEEIFSVAPDLHCPCLTTPFNFCLKACKHDFLPGHLLIPPPSQHQGMLCTWLRLTRQHAKEQLPHNYFIMMVKVIAIM